MPRGPRKTVGSYFGTILKTFSDIISGPSFQRMHREKLKESEREAPTSNGRARARSARARAHPRLSRLAGLQLGMLLLLLRCCCSRCLCSCSSSSPLLFRLLLRLQCLTLPCFSRFPFHDSQVYFWSQKALYLHCFSHFGLKKKGPPVELLARLGSRRSPGSHFRAMLVTCKGDFR